MSNTLNHVPATRTNVPKTPSPTFFTSFHFIQPKSFGHRNNVSNSTGTSNVSDPDPNAPASPINGSNWGTVNARMAITATTPNLRVTWATLCRFGSILALIMRHKISIGT